ncbi:type II toxin-antitoxin system PemK/MazF family toxin [Bifidobacterium ruminantium]|uniref:type II toxin-antitoxin system PemK/MazF family toxin n=1 Tax=Bifidobacterium ruminantium TaxID=78346 RepID=UPI002493B6F8|nr:type II toxin-antitoxin system PemK/MazF family toxin [Bifidobacterium ruminantium]
MTDWRYGDIVMADLDPSKGHEQIKRRPVLVVSNDDFNRNCSLTICAAISHGRGDYELHLPFKPVPSDRIEGGRVDGFVQIEQIRALDLSARNPEKIGRLADADLDKITGMIIACFIQPNMMVIPDYG